MKKYFYISILLGTFALSGCTDGSSDNTKVSSEEPSSKVASKEVSEVVNEEPVILDVITYMENYQYPMGGYNLLMIDEEVASRIGESKSYFSYPGDVPFIISLLNVGTENFFFEIRNVDKEILITNGVLKNNESYEKVFDGFSEGAYVISYLVEEEEHPSDIKLKVKVELLP
ncbi:hypothetical protein CSE16_12730 [Solibacillus sp. R5-41]|uniref:hypothetical protein n=1 Tax=Solibacillus sp. R5-41 TaxID=2048654 RepID=UPI000C128E9A|nr:hypothetical protein [Solibacillus sp. R5-41]ATP40839.1 hypothetical protein CSE16_12730 [Solibacillus sp. R5-41]